VDARVRAGAEEEEEASEEALKQNWPLTPTLSPLRREREKGHMFRLALLTIGLGSGCAFTPDLIRLDPPTPMAAPVPGAERIELKLAVEDLRQDPSQVVARKINGFGMRLAEITSEEPVAEVLYRAAGAALLARGYRVVEVGPVTLTLELLVFSHEFRTGFWVGRSEALVIFLATVRDAEGRERFRRVVSQTSSQPVQLASGANVKKTYEEALAQALESLLGDDAFRAALPPSLAPPVL